jgi:DGQHR domain-containing protein
MNTIESIEQSLPDEAKIVEGELVYRFAIARVTQGRHVFYTLTIPIGVLARTCFVSVREDSPEDGFQRKLNRQRAQDIADYIDTGFGSIPSSIILSAQSAAELSIIGRGKTMQFRDDPLAFLILDGQHRVYGFRLAKEKNLRVPVVIFNGLSRSDETRLFIDINTKQRPVPNELLLDIKKLANYDSETEALLGEIFDRLNSDSDSPLLGLLSPAKKVSGKLSRVTVYAAVKPIVQQLSAADPDTLYGAFSEYLHAVGDLLRALNLWKTITAPTVFRAFMALFPEVSLRVKDHFNSSYTRENFQVELEPLRTKMPTSVIQNPGDSYKELLAKLSKALERKLSF